MMNRTFLTVMAALFALSASAGAAVITVPDASFEDHALVEGDYKYIDDSDYNGAWSCVVGYSWVDYGYWRADGWPEDLYGHSGNNKAYAYDDHDDYIYQILDATFVEGEAYTLSVWVGQPWEGEPSGWSLYFTGEDYNINLIQTVGMAGLSWEQVSLEYTATAADAGNKIGIKMWGYEDVSFDDVTLTTTAIPIPAPAALTLAMLGLGALMLKRKRS